MTTYFVSRHPGAREWAQAEGIVAEHVEHFDTEIVTPGDVVIGTLPIHLAAQVCERGGRFLFLSMEMPIELRKKGNLTVEEMRICNARLEEYQITRI